MHKSISETFNIYYLCLIKKILLGTVVYNINPSIWEGEEGRSQFEASLGVFTVSV